MKLHKLEENLLREEVTWWDDPDMDGVRRAAKALIDKKKYAEIDTARASEMSKKLQGQVDSLSKQNQKINLRLQANSEAFDQLQREVADEASKIKNNSQSLLRKSTQELQNKYENEIERLKEEIKVKSKEKSELKTKYTEEYEKMKFQFDNRVKSYKDELDIQQEKIDRLSLELKGIDRDEYALKDRYLNEIRALENRILELEEFLGQERNQKEQFAKLRSSEVQELSEKIQAMRAEMAEREDKLDLYIKENRNLRAELLNYNDGRKSAFSTDFSIRP